MAGTFPSRGVWRRPNLRPVDVIVFAALLALLFGVLRLAPSLNAPFLPRTAPSVVSTDPADLPYYAVRSLLRMFIALILSVLFTFVYAEAAARLRRAEKVLIPVLDILQSVPVLGFLSVTVTAFINLFPGSELGLECASIFAIFTSMAWNMTFGFYHSLVTQPQDLDEAARVMRLTKWERFWQLDVPGGMIPLVWNGMMSFGGGWFFLAASESISVLNHTYALPGIGSYVTAAIGQGSLSKVGLAIAVEIVLVVAVNVVFWRPLVAWSERFRFEESAAAERPRSVVLDLLRRSSVPALVARPVRPVGRVLDRGDTAVRAGRASAGPARGAGADGGRVLRGRGFRRGAVRGLACFGLRARSCRPGGVRAGVPGRLGDVRAGGGADRGSHRHLGAGRGVDRDEPAGVPAGPAGGAGAGLVPGQLLVPFAVAFFVAAGVSLNVGGILLMALGSQWYILFNVIAGASAIPSDLREATRLMGLRGVLRWRRFILPAVFPAYVTGGITAAGGAWNASIVAEVVSYGSHHLVAYGLGAYIAAAAAVGDFPRVLVGVAVMSVYVVGVNRLVWRPLYRLAEGRYSI